MTPGLVAAALSLIAAVVLLSGLLRIVSTMRNVVRDVDTVRLLLRIIANQTEPVGTWVRQIGENVATLTAATNDVVNRIAQEQDAP